MKKSYGIIALLMLILAGAGLFNLKYMVESKERQLLALQHQVRDDRRAIRVLNAEWAYLNRPDNIQNLAVQYLGLKPVSPKQIYGEFEQIPWRIANGRIDAPLVDFVITQPEQTPQEVREANYGVANRAAGELVLFDAPRRQPQDAIRLLMAGELVSMAGGRP